MGEGAREAKTDLKESCGGQATQSRFCFSKERKLLKRFNPFCVGCNTSVTKPLYIFLL